jgi:hypothetical protein
LIPSDARAQEAVINFQQLQSMSSEQEEEVPAPFQLKSTSSPAALLLFVLVDDISSVPFPSQSWLFTI